MDNFHKKRMLDLLDLLQKKPKMFYLKQVNYSSYEAYLIGFFHNMEINSDPNISRKFSSWLGQYYMEEENNIHWAPFIRMKLEGKLTEEKRINILFELFKQFVNQLGTEGGNDSAPASL